MFGRYTALQEVCIVELRCFLCRQEPSEARETVNDVYVYECPRCGPYRITRPLALNLESEEIGVLACLSAYTRQYYDREHEAAELTTKNWEQCVAEHLHTSASQKMRKLLESIGRRSRHPGENPLFNRMTDYPLIDAGSPDECRFFLDSAKERGLLFFNDNSAALTIKGWEQIEPTAAGGIPGRCFVAMSFDPSLKDAYDNGIYPALKTDCSMEPVRVDRIHHNEKICDKILAEIRRCQFLVADVTLHRQGVYFEAGFAAGLGRPVIWTCQTEELSKVQFDTRQYSHVVWETPADLREKLSDRVRATILK
jgi:hypothetical protein